MKNTLICFLILLSSCTTSYKSSYTNSNKFIKDYYYFYHNDSLKVSIDLFGDYTYGVNTNNDYNNSIGKRDFNNDRRLISIYFPKLDVKKKDFVFKASTFIEPYINTSLYLFPTVSKIDSCFIDTLSCTVICSVHQDDKQYVQLFSLAKNQQQNDNSLPILKYEARETINSYRFNDQYKKVNPKNPFTLALESMGDSANYLNPILSLKSNELNYNKAEQTESLYLQAALTYNSFIENNINFSKLCKTFYKQTKQNLNILVYDSVALQYIKTEVVNRQIVMINEQHWQPKHRYLGNQLLAFFYEQGFRYLAVEAIDEKDDSLNIRKYPLQTSGLYLKEPQFANFIRNALQIGYKIIPYDVQGAERESGQAQNIFDRTLFQNDSAKVLVWAGIAHIREDKSDFPKMAYYLKKISNIDPLTIEQTQGDKYASNLNEHFLGIRRDSILSDKCDIFIYNNIKETDYRVSPLESEKKTEITLSPNAENKLKQHGNLILMVYIKSEFEKHRFNAVPIKNYLLTDQTKISLKLPLGDYYIIIRTPTSSIVDQFDLSLTL